MENILEVKKLSKAYKNYDGEPQYILKNIDLTIGRGEFVAIMGPSGSGKSTLLYNISGMDVPTEGCVRLGKTEITKLSQQQLAHLRLTKMGFIFQQTHLLKNLSIFENIILPAYEAKVKTRDEINRYAISLMVQTEIANLRNRDITEASGGQLQRAGICRAIINDPDIIFGDEPTGALNSKTTSEILEILRRVNEKGKTLAVVTHDAKVAAQAERVLFMLDGRIVDEMKLGKYHHNDDEKSSREKELTSWLIKMGF